MPAEPGLQRNSRTCLVKHLFRPKYPATKVDNPGLHCLPVRCKPCEIQLAQEKHVFTWICGFPQQDQVFQCFKNPLDWKTENTHLTCSAHSSRHAVITLTEGPPNSILDARFFSANNDFTAHNVLCHRTPENNVRKPLETLPARIPQTNRSPFPPNA